jgi:hypothetical protein
MYMTGRNLAFVLANTIAVMVALYIAFASDLERPYWAMFTVFIVAKPIAGAVRLKALSDSSVLSRAQRWRCCWFRRSFTPRFCCA